MIPKIIAVISQYRRVGKSTIALNLALALVSQGYHVLLVDSSAENPSIAKMLGLKAPAVSFADFLEGRVPISEVLAQQYRNTKLDLVLGKVGDEVKFSYGNIARCLLQSVKKLGYDFIIVDGPTPVSDKRSYPIGYDALLVSTNELTRIENTLLDLRVRLRMQGNVHVDFVINSINKREGSWRGWRDVISNTTVMLPYESKMRSALRNEKPILLADKESEFSKGIERLADSYTKRKPGSLWSRIAKC